ncbi:hypothetical protein BH09PLA1_BH09PLA1_08520 [soil metagenome]
MSKSGWMARHADFPWLSLDDRARVEESLRAIGTLAPGEHVARIAKAGEGNMNLTLRAMLSRAGDVRTVIVKQSRPWVEKYNQIDAPWDRANVEAAFLRRAGTIPDVALRMPRLLGDDPQRRILVTEDLGAGSDFSFRYSARGDATALDPRVLKQLGEWLAALHDATANQFDPALANRAMRALNHAHMFEIPLNDPPMLDLDALSHGLADAARELRDDTVFRQSVRAAAERYLADGLCLLHGDFFPGSWLKTERGVFVIDPEFGYFGDREFDLGVAVAHLALAERSMTEPATFLNAYGAQKFDRQRIGINAGIEVMRRLIGVAQLPLRADANRAALLQRARAAVIRKDWQCLWSD